MRLRSNALCWTAMLGLLGAASALPNGPGQNAAGRKTTDPPVAARGKLGEDLFLAIDRRDTEGAKALLNRGADPNSRNGLEFTPLYIASASYQMDVMQALLASGASVDAKSSYGTPLMFAAATGNIAGAQILFAHGAKVGTRRGDGTSVLMMASQAGNPALVAELIKRKADVNVTNESDATALMWAARGGHLEAGRLLLDAGAKIDAADADGVTALMSASMTGHAEFVEMLLQHGARPNQRDGKGRTALYLTAEYGDYPEVAKALLAAGADPKLADSSGKTPAIVASARGYDACAASLGGSSGSPRATRSPRQAAELSLKILQASTVEFERNTACISCHQEGLGRMTFANARDHGLTIDWTLRKMQTQRIGGALNAMMPLHEQALKSPAAMKQVPLIEINEVTTGYCWILAGMDAQGDAPTKASGAMAEVLARQQAPEGCWTFSLPRVPMQSSVFTYTALAAKTLQTYAPHSLGADTSARIRRAKAWLLNAQTKTIDDMDFRLLGLKWCGASLAERQKSIEDILAGQQADGGWNQQPGMASDAYATGQVLYALHVGGGLPTSSPVYQKGIAYLLRTQDDDGTWFVNKRAMPANNYFDAGFPHGESQYASYNGTCWATMALMETLPHK